LLVCWSIDCKFPDLSKPDVRTALQNLAIAFDHYNESHPHSALKYCSPREFRQHAISSRASVTIKR
jgi:putative transposase